MLALYYWALQIRWEQEATDYANSYADYMQWEMVQHNRHLEEMSLGRPLFPNEY